MTRDKWLVKAAHILFAYAATETGLILPRDGWTVACTKPCQEDAIGSCETEPGWPTRISVCPSITDPFEVLGVLLHEILHALDECTSEHHGIFKRLARRVGLAIEPNFYTYAEEGTPLHAFFQGLITLLGPYPSPRRKK